jgi:hypothetical protein
MEVIKQTFGPHCLVCSCPKGGCSGRHGMFGRVKCNCINWGYSDFSMVRRVELKGVPINGSHSAN